MEVRKEDFPIVVQAYEMLEGKEIFVAEQVVNSQADVNTFTARYAGKLIKAKQFSTPDIKATAATTPDYSKKKSSTGTIVFIIILLLIILAAIGYYTGWFQHKPGY